MHFRSLIGRLALPQASRWRRHTAVLREAGLAIEHCAEGVKERVSLLGRERHPDDVAAEMGASLGDVDVKTRPRLSHGYHLSALPVGVGRRT